MKSDHEKRRRLAYVARRYYLDDQKQSDIAAELGISRPMVSRLLTEARQLGVVEITVHDPEVKAASLLERLRAGRSEERRVGKECNQVCRSRWSPYH